MPRKDPRPIYTYKVWDPLDEEHPRYVEARSADEAAETFAEEDITGQRDGLYQQPHMLHVQGNDGDAWLVSVALEQHPIGIATRTQRLT